VKLDDTVRYQALDVDGPEWGKAGKIHDWRNHVPDHIRAIWGTFSDEHKLALAAWADGLADQEEWD